MLVLETEGVLVVHQAKTRWVVGLVGWVVLLVA